MSEYIKTAQNYLKDKTDVYAIGKLEDIVKDNNTDMLTVEFGERIEGRTREINPTEALRLRVHDPLWMLARQWQMGEFRGNNTGTAMSVRCSVNYEDCSSDPIEPVTEQINPRIDYLAKIESAVYYLDLYRREHGNDKTLVSGKRHELIGECPIDWDALNESLVLPDAVTNSEEICLNKHLQNYARTYKGKIFDGEAFYKKLSAGKSFGDKTSEAKFKLWFKNKYLPTSDANDHWQEEDLCYNVKSDVAGKEFEGDRYQGGRLSWYTFDLARKPEKDNAELDINIRINMAMAIIKSIPDGATVKSSMKRIVKALVNNYPLRKGTVTSAKSGVRYFQNSFKSDPFDGYAFYKDIKDLQTAKPGTFREVFSPADIPVALKAFAAELNSPGAVVLRDTKSLKSISELLLDTNARSRTFSKNTLNAAPSPMEKMLNYCGYSIIELIEKKFRFDEPECVLTLPTPATFASAPNKRLWQMEDKKVYLGNSIEEPSEANSVVMRYASMYSNDWMLFPLDTQIGKYITIKEIVVIDTFGQTHVVTGSNRAGAGESLGQYEEQWQMFTNSDKNNRKVTELNGLYYAPQLAATVEGKPVEEVKVLRDEMANMVWGVENLVSDGCGGTMDANLYATQLQEIVNARNEVGKPKHEAEMVSFGNEPATAEVPTEGEATKAPAAKFSYELQSSVPFNWIPFIPQRLVTKGDENSPFFFGGREMVLRRGKMPCYVYDGEKYELQAVRPQGSILRPELEYDKKTKSFREVPMVIHEEAVQATGIRLTKNYQRARWIGGKTYQWLGVYKRQAQTEASSGLVFDELHEK